MANVLGVPHIRSSSDLIQSATSEVSDFSGKISEGIFVSLDTTNVGSRGIKVIPFDATKPLAGIITDFNVFTGNCGVIEKVSRVSVRCVDANTLTLGTQVKLDTAGLVSATGTTSINATIVAKETSPVIVGATGIALPSVNDSVIISLTGVDAVQPVVVTP